MEWGTLKTDASRSCLAVPQPRLGFRAMFFYGPFWRGDLRQVYDYVIISGVGKHRVVGRARLDVVEDG